MRVVFIGCLIAVFAVALVSTISSCRNPEPTGRHQRSGPVDKSAEVKNETPATAEPTRDRVEKPQVKVGRIIIQGSQKESSIRKVAESQLDDIAACSSAAFAGKVDESVRYVELFMKIGGMGEGTAFVQESGVVESTVHDLEIEECVSRTVRSWVFEARPRGGISVVFLRFDFFQNVPGKSSVRFRDDREGIGDRP